MQTYNIDHTLKLVQAPNNSPSRIPYGQYGMFIVNMSEKIIFRENFIMAPHLTTTKAIIGQWLHQFHPQPALD